MRRYDEDMIDFPVSDVWRDHYAAQGLTYPAGRAPKKDPRIPATPRGGFSDEDFDAQLNIKRLMAVIRAQRSEIQTLKASAQRTDSRDSFEGVE